MVRNKSLAPEQLIALLEAVIRDAPLFGYQEKLTNREIRWLGRAEALLEASGAASAHLDFRTARSLLGSYSHSRENLLIPLHDAYSRMELLVPAALQGAFIPGGDTWNGYAAIVRIMQKECDNLLVVDPYLSSAIYIDLAPHSAAKKGVRCITVRRSENHPGLLASANKWSKDPIGANRPVEVRYASSNALHDRLIIVDGKEVWLVSQSLKDIAKRSPASVSRTDGELAAMKIQHYNELWDQCEPLI